MLIMIDMKDCGKMDREMEMESMSTRMEMFMMDNGLMT